MKNAFSLFFGCLAFLYASLAFASEVSKPVGLSFPSTITSPNTAGCSREGLMIGCKIESHDASTGLKVTHYFTPPKENPPKELFFIFAVLKEDKGEYIIEAAYFGGDEPSSGKDVVTYHLGPVKDDISKNIIGVEPLFVIDSAWKNNSCFPEEEKDSTFARDPRLCAVIVKPNSFAELRIPRERAPPYKSFEECGAFASLNRCFEFPKFDEKIGEFIIPGQHSFQVKGCLVDGSGKCMKDENDQNIPNHDFPTKLFYATPATYSSATKKLTVKYVYPYEGGYPLWGGAFGPRGTQNFNRGADTITYDLPLHSSYEFITSRGDFPAWSTLGTCSGFVEKFSPDGKNPEIDTYNPRSCSIFIHVP
jgi:hypothetical protein